MNVIEHRRKALEIKIQAPGKIITGYNGSVKTTVYSYKGRGGPKYPQVMVKYIPTRLQKIDLNSGRYNFIQTDVSESR